VVAVESFSVLASNLKNSKLWILDEIARLLEDEYWEVLQATVKQLYSILDGNFTITDIKSSQIATVL
jgi:uncharacterized circularly permuted ATP-grasp superfamily protein